ncbi:uncharacterized protein N7459_004540 [Penicillium hispanicum]|uniref:uncharacterized protein n=1 Tax=Penicillium hispanicum TaxID=1080232 RepID=UPI002540E7D0|nr:uncharacterized protein N7459_004540 [Penicillium hispanicum]KAJ5584740.1 hypothetical protein N7459_004540 [Penicillium hispanicum]
MSNFAGRWSALLLLSLLSTSLAADKNLIPTSASSSFPQCGLSCSSLYAAQDSCTSAADSSTWVSCFCQSSLVSGLKTSGSVCSNCDASDQKLVSTWYSNYCNSGGSNKGTDNTATTSTSSSTTSSATSTATAGSSSSSTGITEEKKSWWSTHYKWVIMLIVLALAFSAIAALGIWLKKRYDAKRPNLYHGGGGNAASSSGALGGTSGMLSPPPGHAPSAPPTQSQTRGLAAESVASSSRTDVGPKGLTPGSRTRLQKPTGPQSVADVEIRQVRP